MAATKNSLEIQEMGVTDLDTRRMVLMDQVVLLYRLDQERYGLVRFLLVPLLCVLSQTKATIWLRLLLPNLQSLAPR